VTAPVQPGFGPVTNLRRRAGRPGTPSKFRSCERALIDWRSDGLPAGWARGVTEYVADSPPLARPYCPGCEPGADPLREILDVRWCDEHIPGRDGSDDERVNTAAVLSGTAEAGGEMNRRWCELVHRLAPGERATVASSRGVPKPARRVGQRGRRSAGAASD
jgi:hypothetical protein